MPWFDVGVNLLDPRFDIPTLIQESVAHQVTDILVIASDINESEQALSQADNWLDVHLGKQSNSICNLHYTAGVHPHYADATNSDSWIKLEALLADTRVSAVGECGLDFNRNYSTQKNQIEAFQKQLQLAVKHQKGLYLHERDAFDTQISLLQNVYKKVPFLVTHCFTGNTEKLKAYLELGCYIGVTGWVCDDKRGQELAQALEHLPLNRLLLETDSPYLFPKTVRPRAKMNSPKYIEAIAQKVAEIKGISLEQVAQAAYANAKALFK